ncbi:MAG TPA: glycosyltransferase 87 family protein [Methylomirabilota bacterium]|nr:glycosyltransferase 87 family protein [Methylomirabilota bacterium]
MMTTDRRRTILPWLGLVLLLAVGLAIRLLVLNAKGHYGDAVVIGRWADNMATYGPWDFYRHDGALYPALLYAYWPIGVLLDGVAQARAIKGISIPFDLALAVVVYLAARRMVGPGRALVAPAVYLLNPAVLLAGPVWGQVDAAGTLAYLLALLALAGRRFGLAGACGALALLIKPQFGLVLLPIAVVAILRWRQERTLSPVVRPIVGGLVAYAVVAIPLRMDPITYLGRIAGAGSFKEYSSANAANIWGLLEGYKKPDGDLVYVGGVLLLIGLAAALLPLLRRQDLWTILAVGAFVVFAFYFLPTRVHERYLFPAMAILAPLAAANWSVFAAYLLMTGAFAASMLYALVDTTPFTFWPWLEDLVTLPVARIWISLTLIATAATLVVLLRTLRPMRPAPSAPE